MDAIELKCDHLMIDPARSSAVDGLGTESAQISHYCELLDLYRCRVEFYKSRIDMEIYKEKALNPPDFYSKEIDEVVALDRQLLRECNFGNVDLIGDVLNGNSFATVEEYNEFSKNVGIHVALNQWVELAELIASAVNDHVNKTTEEQINARYY